MIKNRLWCDAQCMKLVVVLRNYAYKILSQLHTSSPYLGNTSYPAQAQGHTLRSVHDITRVSSLRACYLHDGIKGTYLQFLIRYRRSWQNKITALFVMCGKRTSNQNKRFSTWTLQIGCCCSGQLFFQILDGWQERSYFSSEEYKT